MQKEAARILIQDTFEGAFDKEQFKKFIKELLNHLEDAPFTYRGEYIYKDYRDSVKTLQRIGKYEDSNGKKIDVLIVNLLKTPSLERARSKQRNFVAKYLKGSRGNEFKDGALVAFVSPDELDWRFSFVKMEYKFDTTKKGQSRVKEEFTPARRYSFLVGENEKSHTAQSRLLPILENTDHDPTFAEIEEAFSIEKVTKEFFENYRLLFIDIKEALDKWVKKDEAIKVDFEEKGVDTVDFTKKLLGQIVFLYFLQKKGWFGVGKRSEWGTGSKRFLRELFDKKHGGYNNFFNDILEPLFYNTLAVERPGDYSDKFDCRIPFLNGGLFDPLNDYDWQRTDILLSDKLFSNDEKTKQGDVGTGILDVFDRYNFTVKEDEPLEKEVAIDPEMLGKVFENLLEVKDRKSKGTYYTPRDIVHYMCQESLINYLATELKEQVKRDDIETLIKHGETALENDALVSGQGEGKGRYKYKLPKSIREHNELMDRKLDEIKVCDPAVGSGAFLVGMMSEIVKTRSVLARLNNPDEEPNIYDFKRDAIQDSLHGVDIDLGAVEIAKLRLWLSLIVDEEDYKYIKPLPNLDYKIMQGNSLLEEYEGIKLIDERFFEKHEEKELVQKRLKDQQSKWQREYFNLHSNDKLTPAKKSEIEKNLRKIEKQLKALERPKTNGQDPFDIFGQTEAQTKADKLLELHEQFFDAHHKSEKDRLHKEIDKLTWDLIATTLKKEGKEDKIEDVKRFQRTNTSPFFLWKLNFADVFRERNGFNVMIANPPYLESRHPSFVTQLKDALRVAVESRWNHDSSKIQRGADLLIYFLELAIYGINPEGIVVFLTQNSWLDTEYGKSFQDFLLEHTSVEAVVDSDFKYFDSKTGPNINTVITIFRGSQPSPDSMVTFARFHSDMLPYAGQVTSGNCSVDSKIGDIRRIKANSDILREQKWGVIISMSDVASELLDILNSRGKCVCDIADLEVTVGQGLNLQKDYLCKSDLIIGDKSLEKGMIPIFTSADGAPFTVENTANCLLDGSKISQSALKKKGIKTVKLFNLGKTSKNPPNLILPRGIGRHFCAWNVIQSYSASGVEIYCKVGSNAEDVLLRLWLMLNSSIAWLLREITGRKNLGGGMLKAEAVDLKRLPIYLDIPTPTIRRIFKSIQRKEVQAPLLELNETHHKEIDKVVFEFLRLNKQQRQQIITSLKDTITNRQRKAKT